MASDVDSLKTSRSNLVAILEAQTAAWVAAGMPPDFSVDGESYQWTAWVKARSDEIKALTETIQVLSSPFLVRSRGRA